MSKLRLLPGLIILMLLLIIGCENDTSNGPGEIAGEQTCLDCHSSEEMLVASLGEEKDGEFRIANKDDG